MGGYVGMTLRDKDGTIHKMSRYTGGISYFIDNDKLYEMDEDHIRKYTKKDIYDDEAKLTPEEYGMVVVDLQSKRILSCNGYTSFGKTSLVSVRLDHRNRNIITEESNSAVILKRMFEKNMVEGYYPITDKEDIRPAPSWEEIKKMIEDEDERGHFMFKLSPPGWKISNYENDSKGFEEMRKELEELGFELTKEEKKDWGLWIGRVKEGELEDE